MIGGRWISCELRHASDRSLGPKMEHPLLKKSRDCASGGLVHPVLDLSCQFVERPTRRRLLPSTVLWTHR
jgi:hypothetical protein